MRAFAFTTWDKVILVALVNSCWYVFRRLVLLTIVALLAAGVYLYVRMDNELRRYTQSLLQSHYQDLDVQLGGARFVAGRGIYLSDLKLSERAADGTLVPIAEVEQLQLLGKIDADVVVSGKLQINNIVAVRPIVWMRRQPSPPGAAPKWNIEQLYPPPDGGDGSAKINIEGMSLVVVTDDLPEPVHIDGISIEAERGGSDSGNRTMHVDVELSNGLAESATAAADIDLDTGVVSGLASLKSVKITKAVFDLLPKLKAKVPVEAEFNALCDVECRFGVGNRRQIHWQADYRLSAGRFSLERLPRPISRIAATGTVTATQLSITQASAAFGKARLQGACNATNWQTEGEFAVRCRIADLRIDSNLRELLPIEAHGLWDRFRPTGIADLEATARKDQAGWKPDIRLICRDTSFADYRHFPYRLEQARGEMHYSVTPSEKPQGEGRLTLQFDATAAGRPVAIRGQLTGLPTCCDVPCSTAGKKHCMPPGWIAMKCERVALHQQLIEALPEAPRARVKQLSPQGVISVDWRIEKTGQSNMKPRTSTRLTMHNCVLRYEKFPYPLTDVTGLITEQDGHWTVQELVSAPPQLGRIIRCRGECTDKANGNIVRLSVSGEAIPLDHVLYSSLPEKLQATWQKFHPTGTIDFAADVVADADGDKPTVKLIARPRDRSVAVVPEFFRYRLERVDGTVSYNEGQVTLKDMRAVHARTSISGNGKWTPNELGGWSLDLTEISIDRLAPTRDLLLAAPERLQSIYHLLNPSGSFAVHNGRVLLVQPTEQSDQLATAWNLKVDCHQADFDMGVKLNDVSGVVHLVGKSDLNSSFTNGELALDSAFWQGIQLTDIKGPIRVENHRSLLGRGAAKEMKQSPRRITASLSGGKVALDANIRHDGRSRYDVMAAASEIDLGRFVHEQFGNTTELSGKLQGEVTLSGTGSSVNLMEGGGRVQVTEAEIYEIPVLVALLKVLRNRTPDTTAFDTCNAVFSLSGEQIKFEELNLLGDAVSLYGRGEANFDREIDLVFHSLVGRSDFDIPVLRSFMGSASEQLMQIEVDGTLDSPVTHRKALPAVSSLIEHLGGDGLNPTNPNRDDVQQR